VTGLADETSSDSTAPGGGSVAALSGALAASLAAMVANLSVPSATPEAGEALSATAVRAQEIKDRLLRAVDEDTAAFEKIIQANRLPKGTPDEQAARRAAILDANKGATTVPLGVLELSVEAIRLAADLVDRGLATAVSDVGTGTRVGLAGAEGAYLNVRINLKGIAPDDPGWAASTRQRADELLRTAREVAAAAWPRIEARMEG
jgi:glutamate formiminotransferase/formiminotetrahydrofolate cyclodeaminase